MQNEIIYKNRVRGGKNERNIRFGNAVIKANSESAAFPGGTPQNGFIFPVAHYRKKKMLAEILYRGNKRP